MTNIPKMVDNLSKFQQRDKLPPKTEPALPKIRPQDLVDISCKAELVDAEGKSVGVCGGIMFDRTSLLKQVPSILAAGRPDVVTAPVFSCRRCGTVLPGVIIRPDGIFTGPGR